MCCIPTQSTKGEGLLRKISSQRKNYGRHESQTLESSRQIRRDYKCCLCFLGRRYGIPFSALHFSHEIPSPGLGILLESLLSSWQKQFRDRVERCQEIFTNPHWCLIHVACMAVICHSLSSRGEEKKWGVPQGTEHMLFQWDTPLVIWKINQAFKADQALINSYLQSSVLLFLWYYNPNPTYTVDFRIKKKKNKYDFKNKIKKSVTPQEWNKQGASN